MRVMPAMPQPHANPRNCLVVLLRTLLCMLLCEILWGLLRLLLSMLLSMLSGLDWNGTRLDYTGLD